MPSFADPPAPGAIFWLEEALALDSGAACPPLAGRTRADVCVVGGGFTGLWTALELKQRDPSLDVVLLEAETCGAGASGRNGGWATGWWDELPGLVEHHGAEQGVWLAREVAAAVERIGTFAAEHGVDCHYRNAGYLLAATGPAHLGSWDAIVAACRAHGAGDRVEELSAGELRRRTGSPLPLGGLHVHDTATIQPALLARGLRRVALERGVRIHEASPLAALERTRVPRVRTPGGSVEAGRVVLATGAWSARFRELRRAIVPVGTHIVLTEPIPDRVRAIGWTGGEAFGDTRLLVHYAQVTAGGRIAFGRGGGAIGPAGRVTPGHHRDVGTVRAVAADFRRFFPDLDDVRLTHAWGGPVDRAPRHLPFAGSLGDHGTVHYAAGYSGNGVAPSLLLARVMAALALDADDAYARCGLVGGPPAYLPPEPLRSLGGVVVRNAVRRAEADEERGTPPRRVDRALRRLVWVTVPPALEPRLRRRATSPPAG